MLHWQASQQRAVLEEFFKFYYALSAHGFVLPKSIAQARQDHVYKAKGFFMKAFGFFVEPASSEPHYTMLMVLCHISTWLRLTQDGSQERQSHVYEGFCFLCLVFCDFVFFVYRGPRSAFNVFVGRDDHGAKSHYSSQELCSEEKRDRVCLVSVRLRLS